MCRSIDRSFRLDGERLGPSPERLGPGNGRSELNAAVDGVQFLAKAAMQALRFVAEVEHKTDLAAFQMDPQGKVTFRDASFEPDLKQAFPI